MKIDKVKFIQYLKNVLDGYTKKMNQYHADTDIYKGYESAVDEYKSLIQTLETGRFDIKEESPI